MLCVGASYSSEDIGLQCLKYGAKAVTFTWRTRPMGFKWPAGVNEVPLMTKVEGSRITFRDGSSADYDAIILCTGYLHYHPFMEDSLRLKSRNRLYPPNLYKGIFWWGNPKLMYIGMQDQYYTFNMFDAQAWYARDVDPRPHQTAVTRSAGRRHGQVDQRWRRPSPMPSGPSTSRPNTRAICLAPTDYPRLDVDMVAQAVQGVGAPQGRRHPDLSRPRPTPRR